MTFTIETPAPTCVGCGSQGPFWTRVAPVECNECHRAWVGTPEYRQATNPFLSVGGLLPTGYEAVLTRWLEARRQARP